MDSIDRRSPACAQWAKRLEKGLVVVLTIAACLIAALGLVAIGLIVFFVFALNNYGSNK
jgi:hypothetical protein